MPGWTKKDAKRHTHKATSAKAQRQWQHVAESAMSRGADEASAIRQANGVIKRRGRGKRKGGKR